MKNTFHAVLIAGITGMAALLNGVAAHADAAAQARRLTHFERLREHNYFQSMSVVNGVPQLVLGAAHTETDVVSLGKFCKVIFDYYAELNSQYTQMVVIDGTTGRQVAVVDASGTHYN